MHLVVHLSIVRELGEEKKKRGQGKRRKRKIITEVSPAVSGTAGFRFVSQKTVPVLPRLNWGLSFVFKNLQEYIIS